MKSFLITHESFVHIIPYSSIFWARYYTNNNLGYLLENNLLLLNINIVGYKVGFIIIKLSFESLNAVILDFRKKGE